MTAVTGAASGCGAAGPERRMKEAQAALEEKYGGEFVVTEYLGQESFENYYTVTAYETGHPDLLFTASVNTERGESGRSVNDTYVSRRVCAALSEMVSVNLSGLMGVCSVNAEELNPYALSSDPEISVKDYLAREPGANFLIYLNYVPSDTTAEEAASVISRFSDGTGIDMGKLAIFIMDEDTLGKAREYIETHAVLGDGYQEIVDAAYVGTASFSGGKVNQDEVCRILKGRI